MAKERPKVRFMDLEIQRDAIEVGERLFDWVIDWSGSANSQIFLILLGVQRLKPRT
jgi:hypothetical protein